MARIFISHSNLDNATAIALRDWLFELGFRNDVFLDIDPERGVAAGQHWQEALRAAADRCEAVLFLVSPAWLASTWCRAEFLLAKSLQKRIFGLLIQPVPFDRLPVEMTAEWQMGELIGEDRTFEVEVGGRRERISFREAGLEHLRRGLERAGLDGRSFPWPPPDEPKRAPYRGLRPLEPQDAAIFFGRDAAIVRGLDRIRGLLEGGIEKFLVILGASGSGKSSFLRAGLWPRLARDDATFLPLSVIRPQAAVISGSAGLAEAIASTFERLGTQRKLGDIKQALGDESDSFGRLLDDLVELAKRRLVAVKANPTIILSIDQAEELFNPEGQAEATRFLALLASVLTPTCAAPTRPILAVATIRSDRYELLQANPDFARVKQALFNLAPISPAEFKSVIEGPARRQVEAGGTLEIEQELTEVLIADAQGVDALPLLAFALEALYRDNRGVGQLTLVDYRRLGGIKGSIAAAVARALSEPGKYPAIPANAETQYECLRATFIPWLSRIDPTTGAPMRRVARIDEIPQTSGAMVERLVGERLLVADRREGADVVEVAHESLLRQWPALASWLEADADNLKLVEGVDRAATEWAGNGRLTAWLDHRAERLAAAECLTARNDFRGRLGDQGRAYLAACRAREDAEERRARLRQRQTASAAVVFAIMALAAGIFGVFAYAAKQESSHNYTAAKDAADSLVVSIATQLRDLEGVNSKMLDTVSDVVQQILENMKKAVQQDESPTMRRIRSALDVPWRWMGGKGAVGDELAALDLSRARMLVEFAETYHKFGQQPERANKMAEESLAIGQQLWDAGDTSPDLIWSISRSHEELADLARKAIEQQQRASPDSRIQSDISYDRVREHLDEALRLRKQLFARFPHELTWGRGVAKVLTRLGDVDHKEHNEQASAEHYKQLHAVSVQVFLADPGDRDSIHELAWSYRKLGEVSERQSDFPQALSSYMDELCLRRRLIDQVPTNTEWARDLGFSLTKLGRVMLQITPKDFPGSKDAYYEVISVRQRLADSDRRKRSWQEEFADSLALAADLHHADNSPQLAFAFDVAALGRRRIIHTTFPDKDTLKQFKDAEGRVEKARSARSAGADDLTDAAALAMVDSEEALFAARQPTALQRRSEGCWDRLRQSVAENTKPTASAK